MKSFQTDEYTGFCIGRGEIVRVGSARKEIFKGWNAYLSWKENIFDVLSAYLLNEC